MHIKNSLIIMILVSGFFMSGCGSDTPSNQDNNTHLDQNQSDTNDTILPDQNQTDVNETVVPDQNQTISLLKDFDEYIDRLYVFKGKSTFNFGSSQTQQNLEATITSMCYTKHGAQFNPCYVCHQNTKNDGRANYLGDGELQNAYLFSDYGFKNRWTNLFVDRSAKIAEISDIEIDTYINTDNYTGLKPLLEDKNFTGYIPDLENYHLGAEAFDDNGFAKDGSGWVAFNYKPLPSTFWPVNGSTDDVLIRLHKDYRKGADGNVSVTVYKFNLAIVEMALKNITSISVDELDENIVGIDLNSDGKLGVVDEIIRPTHYVGKASYMKVETFLFPRYTEFLHSVRYVGSTEDGEIYNPQRMKELRYMIKVKSYQDELNPYDKANLGIVYDAEAYEKEQGNLPFYASPYPDKGLDNKMGWWIQGFIEDAEGNLRLQNHEETTFCMGCHTVVGSTIDSTFSFARKVDGKDGWGYINLKEMVDVPNVGEDEGEILTYLKRVGGGNEFRIHNDINNKYFQNGQLDENKIKAAKNVYELITPTRASALNMNKSYKVLVESQDFIHGRDPNDKPVENVHESVDDSTPTLPGDKHFEWDIRLDWSK